MSARETTRRRSASKNGRQVFVMNRAIDERKLRRDCRCLRFEFAPETNRRTVRKSLAGDGERQLPQGWGNVGPRHSAAKAARMGLHRPIPRAMPRALSVNPIEKQQFSKLARGLHSRRQGGLVLISREDAALAYVQFEVLSYVADQPKSCETLEGITRWWLYRQRLAGGSALVRKAVMGLVREGRLVERRLAGTSPLYAAPPIPPFPPSSDPSAPDPRDPHEE